VRDAAGPRAPQGVQPAQALEGHGRGDDRGLDDRVPVGADGCDAHEHGAEQAEGEHRRAPHGPVQQEGDGERNDQPAGHLGRETHAVGERDGNEADQPAEGADPAAEPGAEGDGARRRGDHACCFGTIGVGREAAGAVSMARVT